MNALTQVIARFVSTNKSVTAEIRGVYTCFIHPSATKIDVKNAFSSLYGVEVTKVNIAKTREKFHNTRK